MTAGLTHVRGASLVEVMVAAAVSALLVALMMEFIGSATRGWGRAHQRADTRREGRDAMALMAADLASVCRSSVATNLMVQGGAEGACPRLAALITRPGAAGDVGAVAYWPRPHARRGTFELVRSSLAARDTGECLLSGGNPLGPHAPGSDEVIARRVRDLRFSVIPDSDAAALAFTTNLPAAIEVSFALEAPGSGEAIPFRCRFPLR